MWAIWTMLPEELIGNSGGGVCPIPKKSKKLRLESHPETGWSGANALPVPMTATKHITQSAPSPTRWLQLVNHYYSIWTSSPC